jgi:hypothetical protein
VRFDNDTAICYGVLMKRQSSLFRVVSATLLLAVAVGWSQNALSQTGGGRTFLPQISNGAGGQMTATATARPPATQTPRPAATQTPRPSGTPTTTTWIFCANEYSGCSFTGRRTVRYGANGVYIYAEHFGGLESCNGEHMGGVPNVPQPRTCEYSSEKLYTTIAAPSADNHSAHTVNVDISKIPLGHSGYDTVRTRVTDELPSPSSDGIGAFRTVCAYSHMAFDDPIVYPGQPGRSHLHAFFGNTGINAYSTADSVATTGNSTCRGGILNRSGYWVPALIDTRTGVPVAPRAGVWYYKTGYLGVRYQDVQPMPSGLRMIAGNMTAQSPAEAPYQHWRCESGSGQYTVPSACPSGDELIMVVVFPQCWDGVNLDSADHRSHMAYASNGCPPSYPVALPEISLNVRYAIEDQSSYPHLRLSSDMYKSSTPGGWSIHGDWFNGWQQSASEKFVRECTGKPADCHAHLLGDNVEMY